MKINFGRITGFTLLYLFFFYVNLFACRFTVREIGFSDLGLEPYHLYYYVDSGMQDEDISKIEMLSFALLHESNVRLEIVHTDRDISRQAQNYLEKHSISSFPSAVFVSPYQESMPFHPDRESIAGSNWSMLEKLVSSPVRTSVVEQLLQSFCVILVVEGKDAEKNEYALEQALDAIGSFSKTADQMPKVVHDEPVLLVVPESRVRDEEVLLMSLGINEQEAVQTSVAIIYGRGRMMGPLLQDEMISGRIIYNLLTVVGSDCECGLDQSWILGRSLPLRWEDSVQSELVRFLGFDVESPMIKTEMSQILSLQQTAESPVNPLEENMLTYIEGTTGSNEQDKARITPAEQWQASQTAPPGTNRGVVTIVTGIGSILFLVAGFGVLIYIMNKKRNASL